VRWSKYSLLLISSGNFFGLQIYHLICSFDCHPTAWSILRMVAEALIGAYVVALTIWYCSNRKVNHHKSLTNHLTNLCDSFPLLVPCSNWPISLHNLSHQLFTGRICLTCCHAPSDSCSWDDGLESRGEPVIRDKKSLKVTEGH